MQVNQQVIQSRRELDVILQVTMCACSLHNLLINHAITQDWMVESTELEEMKSYTIVAKSTIDMINSLN